MINISRRAFFALWGAGTAATAFPFWNWSKSEPRRVRAKIALLLYSIKDYIGGKKDRNGRVILPGVGLEKALEDIATFGFKGVEFFSDCFGMEAKVLRKMLADVGLKACANHVSTSAYGLDTTAWTYDSDVLKKTCEFNLGYDNNLIICPGGGNMPPGCKWSTGFGGSCKTSQAIDDFTKKLVEYYNRVAADAATMGCRIGLHNHTWEHAVFMQDGTSFWDYFFSNTSESVCMEQDVGWSTCAGIDPKEQYEKYPHRSPTLHAKENGMGRNVKEFDAILGQPGRPGAVPVDWDELIPVSEKDGVEWYVVECERHLDNLSAVLPSYSFLKSKGLN